MAETAGKAGGAGNERPLLIKRYASRRLYNTETSDYVTLEDIARFIREGRDVQIVDLKTGEDLTRQYLLQIIADHEAKGENVLPVNVLTDIVRAYTDQARAFMPDFLARSFEMMRESQAQIVEAMGKGMTAGPMAAIPGFAELQRQQQEFLRAMMGGLVPQARREEPDEGDGKQAGESEELAEIKRQLAELQKKLADL